MLEFNLLFIEILLMLSFFIIIFIYSTLSADTIISLLAFLIFLTFLIPFYVLLERLKEIIYINNLEGLSIINLLIFYSNIINFLIGISLFIELIYLFLFC